MNEKLRVGRIVCPALAVIAALIFYLAPWFVLKATAFIPLSLDMTVADILQQGVPTSLWFWATVIGFILVIAAGLVDTDSGSILTTFGGVMILAFPAWSLWRIVFDSSDMDGASISPGWGLFAVTIAGASIAYLGQRVEQS